MSEMHPPARGQGIGMFAMESAVAIAFMALAGVVMWDSWRIGAGWAVDGPRAGYFPFYVGVLIFASSLVTLIQAVLKRAGAPDREFARWAQLRQVSEVLIPSLVYVVVIPWLGIYVSTALFIIWFMRRIGRYGVAMILPLSLGVPVFTFAVFELWFKVPLPKGPLERLLGY